MKNWHAIRRMMVVLALSLAVYPLPSVLAIQQTEPPNAAIKQDPLTRAKAFYASAEFEEALKALESVKGAAANSEAAVYQLYCLVALDRRDEARAVVERIVRADPFFRPAEDVPPRIRAFFDDARKPVLLDVARQSYARARSAFEKKDLASAVTQFDRVITLFDEIEEADLSVMDLRDLALTYRDRARTALGPVSTPKPDPSTTTASGVAAQADAAVYGPQDLNVNAPVPISTPFPKWRPGFFELNHTFTGEIALLLSEDGRVLSASIVSSVHARYDGLLLEAAKAWTFKPATKNGSPVHYRYVMTVQILK